MKIFVAGAGGALGTHLVRRLVADGHEVIGFTRSSAHAAVITNLGASRATKVMHRIRPVFVLPWRPRVRMLLLMRLPQFQNEVLGALLI